MKRLFATLACTAVTLGLIKASAVERFHGCGNEKFRHDYTSSKTWRVKGSGALPKALKLCCTDSVYCTLKPEQIVSVSGDIKDVIKVSDCIEG